MTVKHKWWANLVCAFTGHKYEEYIAHNWTITCSRCGERYYLPKVG